MGASKKLHSKSKLRFSHETLETRILMTANEPVIEQTDNSVVVIGQATHDEVELVLGDHTHVLRFSGHEYAFDAAVVDEFHVAGGFGKNTIKVIGTNVDDLVNLNGERGTLQSSAYRVETYQFSFTTVDGRGGDDSAQIIGSTQDDVVQAFSGWVNLSAPTTTSVAEGFEEVRLFGAGGTDYANLYGSDEADWLGSVGDYVRMVTADGNENRAIGFDRVDAFGRGGSDTAVLLDQSSTDDLFVSKPDYAWLRTPTRKSYVKGFEFVEAKASGGNDAAFFYGAENTSDTFMTAAHEAAFTNGINYQHKAIGFDRHSATAIGHNDTAVLHGWLSDYVLTQSGDTTLLAGTDRNDEAIGFGNVTFPGKPVPLSEFDEFLLNVDPYLPPDVIQDLVEQHFQVPSYDGSANNLDNPTLGQTGTTFKRLAAADPTRDLDTATGDVLPNARAISNAIFGEGPSNYAADPHSTSDILWQWGQFIDHDITLTEHPDTRAGDPAVGAAIDVPFGDPQFDPFYTGQAEIDFTRSNSIIDEQGQNQQINKLTAFIDGSQVYGSDETTANHLRSFDGGKLRMSDNNLLPIDYKGHFEAGDVRVNEQPGLTSMHTLFAREHNRLADELATANPHWSDEEIYQAARLKNIGIMQSITYNEFLPTLLGENSLSEYGGYDSSVDVTISNEFATAAFRFGHSMISGELKRMDQWGNTIPTGNLSLAEAFFNPSAVVENGIEVYLMGLSSNVAQSLDHKVVNEVRNMLFGPPGAGGLDLAALNIQRGRDHELASYNDTREALGLERITSWDDPIFQAGIGEKLASVYDSIDDVDLWVGGLAEANEGPSMMGELFTLINAQQFEAIRDGDRFFYKNTFSGQELADIHNVRLSDVVMRNTSIDHMKYDMFQADSV